jgi:tetratricopeptide (TPR) repeat protein
MWEYNIVGGPGWPLPLAIRTGHPEVRPARWIQTLYSDDPRALWNPRTRQATPAWWDDRGENHPFDWQGPDLYVDLVIPPGDYRLSLYFLDWFAADSPHPQRNRLRFLNREGQVLCTSIVSQFGQGVYKQYAVRGPLPLTLHLQKDGSLTGVLSGLFLDRFPTDSRLPLLLRKSTEAEEPVDEAWTSLQQMVTQTYQDPLSVNKFRQPFQAVLSRLWSASLVKTAPEKLWWLYEGYRLWGDHAAASAAAQRLGQQYLATKPSADQILEVVAQAKAEDRYELAKLLLEESLGNAGPPAEVLPLLEEMAQTYLQLGLDRQAKAVYQKIVEGSPAQGDQVRALYRIGMIELTQQNYAAAEEVFGRLLANYPEAMEADWARSQLAFLEKRKEQEKKAAAGE